MGKIISMIFLPLFYMILWCVRFKEKTLKNKKLKPYLQALNFFKKISFNFLGFLLIYFFILIIYYYPYFLFPEKLNLTYIINVAETINSWPFFPIAEIVAVLWLISYFSKEIWILIKYILKNSLYVLLILSINYWIFEKAADMMNLWHFFLRLLNLGIAIFIVLMMFFEKDYLSYNLIDICKNYIFNNPNKIFKEYLSDIIKYIDNEIGKQVENQELDLQKDKPIGGALYEDLLNRTGIVEKLDRVVSKVAGWNLSTAYTIGLIGGWGDGKTSVLNMLENQYLIYKKDFKILKFNPWDYDKKNLINKFFEELAIVTDCDIKSELNTYLEKISNINTNFKPLSLFIQPLTLEKAKEKLNQKLKSLNKTIVVIIDDLDRCSPDEVVLMLNIVKNLGDLANIIYILSYDKVHIEQSLDKKDFDKDYLEKIVNYELFLNNPTTEEKKEFITTNLKEIFNGNESINKIIENFSNEEIYPLRNENIRFLKRLFNTLSLLVKKDVMIMLI